MRSLLSICEHDATKNKRCRCGAKAYKQIRTYIRPGNDRYGSLAYSLYLCNACIIPFKARMLSLDDDRPWNIKIDIDEFTLEKEIILEWKDGSTIEEG